MILNYILSIDTDTMEFTVKDAECPKNAVTMQLPSKETPRLHLEKNRFVLNNEAIKLLNLKVGDKVSIAFTAQGTPIIGTNETLRIDTGNKLTKANSVSFRGHMNDVLMEKGTDFDIELDEDNVGILQIAGKSVECVEQIEPDDPEPVEKHDDSFVADLSDLLGKDEDFTMSAFDFSLD